MRSRRNKNSQARTQREAEMSWMSAVVRLAVLTGEDVEIMKTILQPFSEEEIASFIRRVETKQLRYDPNLRSFLRRM